MSFPEKSRSTIRILARYLKRNGSRRQDDIFSTDDSHFFVFFPIDKTVKLLPMQRLNFKEDSNVVVIFETVHIQEDGMKVIEAMPYDGKVIFSGDKYHLSFLLQDHCILVFTVNI